MARIDKYFRENKLTMEKILMLEKGTGYDLSKYKRKINEKNYFFSFINIYILINY